MQGSGIREAAAWRGRGAVHAFTVRYDRWRLSALLEADEPDADSPRLLEHARTGLMGALGAAWTASLDPSLFLQKVLDQANRDTWYRIRTNPMWEDRFVGVLLALTDGDQVWLGQAGHGRVFGGDGLGFTELLRPQTAATRMMDDGTAPSWEEAPDNLRCQPLQGLGLPPQDFSPRLKGPIPHGATGTILLTSFALGDLAHPSEFGTFLNGEGGDEAGLGRLLDYCRSRDASADVGAVSLAWGGGLDGWGSASDDPDDHLPEAEETWQSMDRTARGDGTLLRNLALILLAAAVIGVGIWWIMNLGETHREPESRGPTGPPPLESLYREGEAPPAEEVPGAAPLPEEADLPPLRPMDDVDLAPMPIPIIHKITPINPEPEPELEPELEPEPEAVHEIKLPSKPRPEPKSEPKPRPKPRPKPKPEPEPGPEIEESGLEPKGISLVRPDLRPLNSATEPLLSEPEPPPGFGDSPGAGFAPKIKLPERERALDLAPDEEEPEIGPDGAVVMDFTGDDEDNEPEAGNEDEASPSDPEPGDPAPVAPDPPDGV
ncbi:MAG: hypothetical protein ABIK09_04635 [Pseudomonadota bacterium]